MGGTYEEGQGRARRGGRPVAPCPFVRPLAHVRLGVIVCLGLGLGFRVPPTTIGGVFQSDSVAPRDNADVTDSSVKSKQQRAYERFQATSEKGKRSGRPCA